MASNKNDVCPESKGEHQKPRFSLLQLFDPLISSRRSTSPNKQNNINLGSTSGEIKTTSDDNQNNKTQPLLILEDSFLLNTSNSKNNVVLDSEGNIVDSSASGKANVGDHQESSEQLQNKENILDLTNVTFSPGNRTNCINLANEETLSSEAKNVTNLELSVTEKDHFYSALEILDSGDAINSGLSESNMSEGSDKISTFAPGEETISQKQDSSDKQSYNLNETMTLCTSESALQQENDMDNVKITGLDETIIMERNESLGEANKNLTLDQEDILLQAEKSDDNNMARDAKPELDILKINELDKNDLSETPRSVDLETPNLAKKSEIVHHHSEEPNNHKHTEMGEDEKLKNLENCEFGENVCATDTKFVGVTVPDFKPDLMITPPNSEKLCNINSSEIKEQDEFENKESNEPHENSPQSEKSETIMNLTLESGIMELQSNRLNDTTNNTEVGKKVELNDSRKNEPDEGSYLEEDTLVNQSSLSLTVNSEQVREFQSAKTTHEKVENDAHSDQIGNDEPNKTLVPEQFVPDADAYCTSGMKVEQHQLDESNTVTEVTVEDNAQLEHVKDDDLDRIIKTEKNEHADDESSNSSQAALLQTEQPNKIGSIEIEEGPLMKNETNAEETDSVNKGTDNVKKHLEVPQLQSEETTNDSSEKDHPTSELGEIRPETSQKNEASINSSPTENDGTLFDQTVICKSEVQLPQNGTLFETKETSVSTYVDETAVHGETHSLSPKEISEERNVEIKFATKSVQKDIDMLNKSTEITEGLLEPSRGNPQEQDTNAPEKNQLLPENLIKAESVNKEILDLQQNILELQGKVLEKDQEKQKFNEVLKAHEKKIREYYQQYIAEYNSRKEATQSLSNLESALYDLVEKYKKAKTVITDFQENENRYKAEIEALHENIKQLDEQYICLKDHSQKTVERANLENRRLKESYDEELMKQKAYVKRMEIKLASTETNLAQKVRECEQLSSVLDQLTGKV